MPLKYLPHDFLYTPTTISAAWHNSNNKQLISFTITVQCVTVLAKLCAAVLVYLCCCVGGVELSNRHMNQIMNGVCSYDSSYTHRVPLRSSDI